MIFRFLLVTSERFTLTTCYLSFQRKRCDSVLFWYVWVGVVVWNRDHSSIWTGVYLKSFMVPTAINVVVCFFQFTEQK